MARISEHTARQRYERVPVMEGGEQKRILLGTTRKGDREIWKKVTQDDKSKPLAPWKCERCGTELTPGTKYRSCVIKQQYGSRTRFRCMVCPVWQPWEYTDALWARVAQIQAEGVDGSDWTEEQDAQDRADELASMIEELLGEKQEALDAMPDGLRDASELNDRVSELEDWKQAVEDALSGVSFPDAEDCVECEGTGSVGDGDEAKDCSTCDGGNIEAEVSEEALDDWREEAAEAILSALDDAAVG